MSPELFVADEGRGRPVLLVHGQPGLGDDWDAVARRLVADHRVLVPDRPGYGQSGTVPATMAANAEMLASVLVARGASPATVVGHSYGGGIAVLMATRRPEVVSALVLVSSVGRADGATVVDHLMGAPWVGEALAAAGLLALGRVLPKVRGLATHVPGHRLTWFERNLPDERFAAVASLFGRQIWRSFVFEQRALLREIADIEAALPNVAVPTVVLSGTWDIVVPPSLSAALAATIPGAELLTEPRMGHFLPRDAPDTVAEAVRQVDTRALAGRPVLDPGD